MKTFAEVLIKNKELLQISKAKFSSYLIVSLCTTFIASSNFIYSFMLQEGVDSVIKGHFQKFIMVTFVFVTSSILYGVCFYYGEKNKEILSQNISLNLKTKLFYKINSIDFEKSSSYKKGYLFTLIHVDADNISKYVTTVVFPFIQVFLSILIGTLYVAYYSWKILIVAILGVPFFIYINSVLSKRIRCSFDSVKMSESNERDLFTDIHNNSSSLKVFSINYVLNTFFKRIYESKTQNRLNHEKNCSLVSVFMESGILTLEFLMLLVAVPLVKLGKISLGALLGTWNAATGTFIYPITDIPGIISKMSEIHSSWIRVLEILNIPDEKYTTNTSKLSNPKLVARKVNFKHNSDSKEILTDINFELSRNQIAIILGESGSGKSTFLKLLLSLYKCSSGDIFIKESKNKIDINTRNHISFVPQGNSLLNISIYDNLTMGHDYDFESVKNAVKLAQIDDFIETLPNKFNTIINDEIEISEGQAQRLAIARALLHDSDFIIMDEPFSALDLENESKIINVINQIKLTKGVIIITHRAIDKIHSDYVYEILGGKLYEK